MAELFVPKAIDANPGRSNRNLEVNSADKCWASAKLPPLPKKIILSQSFKAAEHCPAK
jgi:hypothetical protein